MRAAFGKTRTLPAAQIAEPCPTGPDPLFSNQDQVEDAGARRLTERFTQAHSAPINSGQLLEDVGVLADTPATGQILRGSYKYPADIDPATKSLLQEASKIFHTTAEDGVTTFVTSNDYTSNWRHSQVFMANRGLTHKLLKKIADTRPPCINDRSSFLS